MLLCQTVFTPIVVFPVSLCSLPVLASSVSSHFPPVNIAFVVSLLVPVCTHSICFCLVLCPCQSPFCQPSFFWHLPCPGLSLWPWIFWGKPLEIIHIFSVSSDNSIRNYISSVHREFFFPASDRFISPFLHSGQMGFKQIKLANFVCN